MTDSHSHNVMVMVSLSFAFVFTTSVTSPAVGSKQAVHDNVQFSDKCWKGKFDEEPQHK